MAQNSDWSTLNEVDRTFQDFFLSFSGLPLFQMFSVLFFFFPDGWKKIQWNLGLFHLTCQVRELPHRHWTKHLEPSIAWLDVHASTGLVEKCIVFCLKKNRPVRSWIRITVPGLNSSALQLPDRAWNLPGPPGDEFLLENCWREESVYTAIFNNHCTIIKVAMWLPATRREITKCPQ